MLKDKLRKLFIKHFNETEYPIEYYARYVSYIDNVPDDIYDELIAWFDAYIAERPTSKDIDSSNKFQRIWAKRLKQELQRRHK